MIIQIADSITNKLVENKIITKEIEIHKYGIAMMISYAISVTIIMGIGLLNNTLVHSVIYLLCFDKLRSYGGGYHANTYFKCISFFSIIYFLYLLMIFNLQFVILFPIALLLWIFLIKKFPIEHPNKKLTENEKRVHGKHANLRFVFTLVLAVLLKDFYMIGNALCSASILILILCYIQLFLNKEELK